MNGASLLLVLASIGITANMEIGPNGQPTYMIRIEPEVLDLMRQGQEIETNLATKDRIVRRFRILVTPDPRKPATASRAGEVSSRAESLVEYEPVVVTNNGVEEVEMWVQIAPERLETLAAGKAIDGDVASEVREVHRFRVFVGLNQLPSQQRRNAPSNGQAPFLLTAGEGQLTPPGAGSPTKNETPRLGTTAPRSGSFQPSPPSSLGNTTIAPLGTRPSDRPIDWRNNPDQSTMAPPPVNPLPQTNPNYAYQQPVQPAPGSYGYDPRTPVPYADPYGVAPAPGYNYGASQPPPQNAPLYGSNPWPSNLAPNYSQAQAVLAARPDAPQTTAQPAAQAPAAAQPQAAPAAAPVTTVAATPVVHQTAVPARSTEERMQTSTPLILTTLALFTSLGVNAYLGWLAYSFFWRYREAVNDSARARSYNAPSRQAA